MDTILGALHHMFDVANKTHIIWCGAILVTILILAVLHHFWKDDAKKIRLWRVLCFIPVLTAAVHAFIYVWGCPKFFSAYIPLYLIPVFALLPIPFANRKIGYTVTMSFTGVLSVMFGLYFCLTSPNYFNYTRDSYTDSFHALVQEMDENYVLKEWKEVDFAALEDKYMPKVQEAEQEQSPEKFADAVRNFSKELHDGHVAVGVMFAYDMNSPDSELKRYEYGLSMVQLDNDDVIAVCTTDEVNALGIEDGTVITKWDGKPILQAVSEDVMDHGFPVKANDDRIATMVLSGLGGDTVDVTFVDDSGKEQTVTLSDLGEMHTYTEADSAFSHSTANEQEENFSTKMLNDKCGYLLLKAEETDNVVHDFAAYLSGNHKWAREMFREKLRDLKSQGMEYLVIDLRNNGGGYDTIGTALCDLLTDEDWYGWGLGIRKDGEYVSVCDQGIYGDGEFADLQVVVLTNYHCASAGDGTSLYLSKLPNVTVAGITDPCGCNQETGGECALSDGLVYVSYPVGLILDQTGVPNVDTKADRISRNPVEERIPLDYDAAMKIFHEKEDYELDWAINYLEENAK